MAKRKRAVVKEPDVPECEKLRLTNEQGHNRIIGDFLTFLQGLSALLSIDHLPHNWWPEVEDINIERVLEHLEEDGGAERDDEVILPFWQWLHDRDSGMKLGDIWIEDTLYEYFGIDRDKLETERREMLAGCRAGNALHDARKELGLEG